MVYVTEDMNMNIRMQELLLESDLVFTVKIIRFLLTFLSSLFLILSNLFLVKNGYG